ncbi:hypothetical protein FRB99_008642 [Tulasnella sp. 403]|nr:hypothetical protein FRB99_008642 [Tulasnella sp. 403]
MLEAGTPLAIPSVTSLLPSDIPMTYSLPPEIWFEIFLMLRETDSSDALRTLCLVCHHFCDIAQPMLFETVTLKGADKSGFLTFLNGSRPQKDKLRSWIRRLKMIEWMQVAIWPTRTMANDGTRELFASVEDLLPKLHRLQSVMFKFSRIPSSALSVVAQLPMLQELIIEDCYFEEGGDFLTLYNQGPRRITHLEMVRSCTPNAPVQEVATQLALLPTLKTANLGSCVFRIPEVQDILRSPHKPLPALKQLTIGWQSMWLEAQRLEGLFLMLKCCTALERLEIKDCLELGETFQKQLRAFSEPFLPNLRRFDGSPEVARVLCAGSPLETLRINEDAFRIIPKDLLTVGTRSLRVLCFLNVTWQTESLEVIAKGCPQLEMLSVIAPLQQGYTKNIPQMPHLVTLSLLANVGRKRGPLVPREGVAILSLFEVRCVENDYRKAEKEGLEGEVIKRLVVSCPKLFKMHLFGDYYWIKTHSDGWEIVPGSGNFVLL